MLTIEEQLLTVRAQLTELFAIVENLILNLQEQHAQHDDSDSSSESDYNSSDESYIANVPNQLEPIYISSDSEPEQDNVPLARSMPMLVSQPVLNRQPGQYFRRDHGFESLTM